jgi:hypothetical protein
MTVTDVEVASHNSEVPRLQSQFFDAPTAKQADIAPREASWSVRPPRSRNIACLSSTQSTPHRTVGRVHFFQLDPLTHDSTTAGLTILILANVPQSHLIPSYLLNGLSLMLVFTSP